MLWASLVVFCGASVWLQCEGVQLGGVWRLNSQVASLSRRV